VIFEGFQKHKLKHLPLFFGLGFFGVFGVQSTYIVAIYFTNANFPSLFIPMYPMVTTLFGYVLGLEKFTIFKLWGISKFVGMIITILGGFVIVFLNGIKAVNEGSLHNILIGVLMMLFNSIGFSMRTVLQKKFLFQKKIVSTETQNTESNIERPYTPIYITLWAFIYAAMLYLIIDIYILFTDISIFKINLTGFFILLYSSFISSAFTLMLFTFLNSLVSPLVISGFTSTQTLFTIIFSYILFNDIILFTDYIGGFMVIIGLLFIILGSYFENK
jgi:drug/metabolite transporter (DMT)-like permease